MPAVSVIRLTHMRLSLALHILREADGPALLMLHGLGEATPARPPAYTDRWPGPVYGLDFTGHGSSDIPAGGGYTSEALIGDVDSALAHLGEATLLGRGLGRTSPCWSPVPRPEHVRGAIMADGPGLAGGGPVPASLHIMSNRPMATETPDPFALAELARELRPPELALAFVAEAASLPALQDRLIVSSVSLPPWLGAVATHPAVRRLPIDAAVAELAHTSTGVV